MSSKKPPTKRAAPKTVGDDIIDVDASNKKSRSGKPTASAYFSTTCKKGYTVNPWSKETKNFIDVVFHDGGVPTKSEEPNITLDEGGKELPEKLFTAIQATAQQIPMDSARYNGYCNTQDHMKAAGVHPVEKCYRSVPQVVHLEQECTGVPDTMRYDVPTNNHVAFEGTWHRQFNSMYVSTLQVAKDRHTLTTGPKSMGIASFGDVEPSRGMFGGGGGYGGGSGRPSKNPTPSRVSTSTGYTSDDE
jgi:hypothetical protein